jgi:hypothetical protein
MMVQEGVRRFLLGKSFPRNNVLFPYMLVVIIENPNGGVHDGAASTTVLC